MAPDWPQRPEREPISGVVSLRELQHPVSKKAIRAAYEAQPGVGRATDARAEFQKALDIGPPAAPIYADLAFTSAATGEFAQAVAFARKALELDPDNSAAQRLLKDAPH